MKAFWFLGFFLLACETERAVLSEKDDFLADVTFDVDVQADRRPIAREIYGFEFAYNGPADRDDLGLGSLRINNFWHTAYNWENNAANGGIDWCYENHGQFTSRTTPGAGVEDLLVVARARSATAIWVLPIVDFVAADRLGGSGPPSCSGDVRASGPDYLQTRFLQNLPMKPGVPSLSPDLNDRAVYQDEFAGWVRSIASATEIQFVLDLLPERWSFRHPEVHPEATTYAELCARNSAFGAAVKRGFPGAMVAGMSVEAAAAYGSLIVAPDSAGKGPFIDYFLDCMAEADRQHGRRVVDYLGLHWLMLRSNDSDDAANLERLQSPRALWDPTFTGSDLNTSEIGAPRLISRTREHIAAHYPGTGIAFPGWFLGGPTHISGAIAVADVLGVFGREGVASATMGMIGDKQDFALAAFRAYRNYDGAFGRFGDVSVRSATSNIETSAVHAAIDSDRPSRVSLVAINKLPRTQAVRINVRNTRVSSAQVFQLTANAPQMVASTPLVAKVSGRLDYLMPPMSVSTLVAVP